MLRLKISDRAKKILHKGTLNLLTSADSRSDIKNQQKINKKASGVTCHVSCVKCHMSHIVCHQSHFSNANSHSQGLSLCQLGHCTPYDAGAALDIVWSTKSCKGAKKNLFCTAIFYHVLAKIANSETFILSELVPRRNLCVNDTFFFWPL